MIRIKYKLIIKKIIATALLCTFALSQNVFASSLTSLYDLTEVTKLSSGVTHESIKKLTTNGWMNINVVRADLTDENTKTGPLYNTNGTSIKAPLSSIMSNLNAIAGINGDFFIMDNITQSYGPIINNGEIISSPYPSSEKYPTLSFFKDGTIDVSVWNPTVYVKNSEGKAIYTPLINKGASIKYNAVLLNEYYGAKTPGNTIKNIVEVVIKDNKVIDIRENLPPTTIPKGGYVISCASNQKDLIKNTFKVGEQVELTFSFDFDLNKMNWAVGGVNYLVKDGKLNDIHNGVLGSHPRTAVGFNKDNTEIMFVTIDGRNKNYIGITQTELASIMVSLGAYNVINLDGGGSTTMGIDFLKNGNIEVVNFPSDGRERSIASGLGIFSIAPNDNITASIELVLEHDKIFNNTEVSLDLKAFNKYYSEVSLENQKVEYSVDSSQGKIVDNKFIPSNPGVATITARVGDLVSTAEINVLDKPVTLSFEDNSIMLNSGETYLLNNILGVDKDGNSAYISPNSIDFYIRNAVGKIENGVFTANDTTNTGAITAICGDAISNIIVKVGYKANTIFSFENTNDLTFSTYPIKSNGGIEASSHFYKEMYGSVKLSYDFTNMTDQSIAFVNFDNNSDGLVIKDKPLALGMWVYGDNSKHWLRTRVQDSKGNTHKIDFAEEIDWEGWKYVTAKLPADISYPVTVKNVYIAEINETRKDCGEIYIDSLRALYKPNDKNLKLRKESVFTDKFNVDSMKSYEQKLTIKNGAITLENVDNLTIENPIYLNVDITNGTIGYKNVSLWDSLKSLSNYNGKNIVLSLNKNINSIVDIRERTAINNIIEETSINNKVFIVWKDSNEHSIINSGIRYIQYDDTFELYLTSDETYYKN
ncbi:phosphodiester glycosidase family protein [Sedimentibacter sp. zth1]|uniref:phosphodiester glycosidase family protein n=1 Tax=Sedimentibacter sp. zth1 TaxID=2816908 RepID=UPI001A92325A|nr:phosphodiester glycosidase family protein [Sedimentibacter sp. zth1]QSX05385.1 phosphodiester glycosidase family protein [Sedimentibacter sp. zth1]